MADPLTDMSLGSLETFCVALEEKSFTRAAKRLSLTPQAVSRTIGRLEVSLGVALFRRTTRAVAPTAHGQAYYAHCKQALTMLATGRAEIGGKGGPPRGTVSVSAPTTFGHHRLIPALATFRARYPGVALSLHISNRNVDFVREGFDVAIRMGEVQGAAWVARSLGDYPLGVFASPAYVHARGSIESRDALSGHDCIAFVLPSTGRILPWDFASGSVAIEARHRVMDDPLACLGLAAEGFGLTQAYHFLARPYLRAGTLVEVLHHEKPAHRRFSLIYPKDGQRSRAVRAFIDFVVAELRESSATP